MTVRIDALLTGIRFRFLMTVELLLTNSNPKTQQGNGDMQDDGMQQDLNDRQKRKCEEEIPVYAVLCHMFLL